jgi:antirestriction protein ArdC
MDNRVVERERQAIVDLILKKIEGSELEWSRGWHKINTAPQNALTGQIYRGVNFLTLAFTAEDKGWDDPRWITYAQAEGMNAHVKKGERGSRIFKFTEYDRLRKKSFDRKTTANMTPDERDGYMEQNVCRYTTTAVVFNAAQVEGLPVLERHEMSEDERANRNAYIDGMLKQSGVRIMHGTGVMSGEAYYAPDGDFIHLPAIKDFKGMNDYYATALHELSHSTGHKSRLNRPFTTFKNDPEGYSKEELRAEFASMFLQAETGIVLAGEHFNNHAAYVQHYVNIIRKDKSELFKAIADAKKIAEYVNVNYAVKAAAELENTKKNEPVALADELVAEHKRFIETEQRKGEAAAKRTDTAPAQKEESKPASETRAGSPLWQEYSRVKEKNPDTILFYRVGDFYELFGEDAKTASRELELTLTGRDVGLPERMPMCGVPYRAVDGYVGKLGEGGYKIAIAENAGEIRQAVGLTAEVNENTKKSEEQLARTAASKPLTDYQRRNLDRLADIERNTPQELLVKPNWCVYKSYYNKEKQHREKFILKAFNAPEGAKRAKSNDPATWTSFAAALKFARDNGCEGLSYALDGAATCIDLDKCLDGKTQTELADRVLGGLEGTYVEKSMSGTGMHIFLTGDLLEGGKYKNCVKDHPLGGDLEVYSTSHFISMTGALISDTIDMRGCTPEGKAFIRQSLGERSATVKAAPARITNQTDADVVERIRRSKKGEVFDKLYAGQIPFFKAGGEPDHSRADFAMLNILAFFTDCDTGQMERIFCSSGLYRPNKDSYVRRSIENACSSLSRRADYPTGAVPAKKRQAQGVNSR